MDDITGLTTGLGVEIFIRCTRLRKVALEKAINLFGKGNAKAGYLRFEMEGGRDYDTERWDSILLMAKLVVLI